jgi:predicted phosphoribosyltransferase
MIFTSRAAAARLLAEELVAYKGVNPLILAIPRGAVPMGKILADALGGELDVVLVRKLGLPGNPEYAIGSVDERGHVTLNDDADVAVDRAYLESETATQLATIRARRALYTPVHAPVDPERRIVIIVDDGAATGATMLAALQSVRDQKPKKLIAAVAVAPAASLKRLRHVADDVVCLDSPPFFGAVSEFFTEFPQVEDAEVVQILMTMKKHSPTVLRQAHGGV